jgi:hypothetical protein
LGVELWQHVFGSSYPQAEMQIKAYLKVLEFLETTGSSTAAPALGLGAHEAAITHRGERE